MKMRIGLLLVGMLVAQISQADMTGSADHPDIPRIAGAEIYGYAYADYDAGNLLKEDGEGKLAVEHPEGARTRILYIAKPGDTPIMVMRNYTVALEELGEVTEIYSCRNDCRAHTFSTTLWTRDTMPPTEGLPQPFYLLAFTHNYGSASYRYAEVVTDKSKYHVGVYSAVLLDKNPNPDVRNQTAVLVEIVEIKDFEPTLEFVDASTMQTEIAASGHVALYGIQFDHDQASFKPESQSTIDEIAKVLKGDPGMKLYIVGHTDDVGALEYNNDLSKRRAASVVEALVAIGIEATRLTPIGIGPAAPIGSNDSEDGRALNRRVELVRRVSSN
jgi:outer membrane protein OmpA-like peptidoglycan-associated protein